MTLIRSPSFRLNLHGQCPLEESVFNASFTRATLVKWCQRFYSLQSVPTTYLISRPNLSNQSYFVQVTLTSPLRITISTNTHQT